MARKPVGDWVLKPTLNLKLPKRLAEKPLWLPREMISRGYEGAKQIIDHLPNEAYTQEVVFLLFHGNSNASYAVMERIKGQEKQYSPALRRVIERWLDFSQSEFDALTKSSRNVATHNYGLPELREKRLKEAIREDGTTGEAVARYFISRKIGPVEMDVFFQEWMLEVWLWWIGGINQLHRMYMKELERSGDSK